MYAKVRAPPSTEFDRNVWVFSFFRGIWFCRESFSFRFCEKPGKKPTSRHGICGNFKFSRMWIEWIDWFSCRSSARFTHTPETRSIPHTRENVYISRTQWKKKRNIIDQRCDDCCDVFPAIDRRPTLPLRFFGCLRCYFMLSCSFAFSSWSKQLRAQTFHDYVRFDQSGPRSPMNAFNAVLSFELWKCNIINNSKE